MSNLFRGETALTVNGKTLSMRLSLGALADLEERLGAEGLLPLVERFECGAFKAHDIIVLLHAGLKAKGWDGSEQQLRDATIDGGAMEAARAAGTLLRLAFSLPETVQSTS